MRHHAESRVHLFDPADSPLEKVNLHRLKHKRITTGVSSKTGNSFRIEDGWCDNRPFKDGTRSLLIMKQRKAADIKRHKILCEIGPWTGTTTFTCKLADAPIKYNPKRRSNKVTGKIRRLDHPKVPQDEVGCAFFGNTESAKAKLRAARRAEAYKEACRRWYTDESIH